MKSCEVKKTGTKEWAAKSVNFCNGCQHECRYCYARQMKVRFGLVTTEEWHNEIVDFAKVEKSYGKVRNDDPEVYDIMLPTSHDITPEILDPCVIVLKKLLMAGNSVLIVSKPHMECVKRLVKDLEQWKSQIIFRFTITSMDNKLLKYWEPGAPLFKERLDSLKYCHQRGYKTSVSIEPPLDMPSVKQLVDILRPHVNETIWVGMMMMVRSRVKVKTAQDKAAVELILANQVDDKILTVYNALKGYPEVRFKESIMAIVTSHRIGKAA